MARVGRPRKRRNWTAHSGVKLKLIKRTDTWVTRWRDPATDHEKQLTLDGDDLKLTTNEARRAWAASKAETLRQQKAAISAGLAITTRTPIKEAIKDYFKGAAGEGLKDSTLKAYHEGADPFEDWCLKNGVSITEELTGPKLGSYRRAFVARRAFVPVKGPGERQGARELGDRRRSPLQVNKCLRALRTILTQWRREGKLPGLDSDAIKDNLWFVKVTHDTPRYLRAPDIKTLLEAAKRHDKATLRTLRSSTTPRARPASQPCA